MRCRIVNTECANSKLSAITNIIAVEAEQELKQVYPTTPEGPMSHVIVTLQILVSIFTMKPAEL